MPDSNFIPNINAFLPTSKDVAGDLPAFSSSTNDFSKSSFGQELDRASDQRRADMAPRRDSFDNDHSSSRPTSASTSEPEPRSKTTESDKDHSESSKDENEESGNRRDDSRRMQADRNPLGSQIQGNLRDISQSEINTPAGTSTEVDEAQPSTGLTGNSLNTEVDAVLSEQAVVDEISVNALDSEVNTDGKLNNPQLTQLNNNDAVSESTDALAVKPVDLSAAEVSDSTGRVSESPEHSALKSTVTSAADGAKHTEDALPGLETLAKLNTGIKAEVTPGAQIPGAVLQQSKKPELSEVAIPARVAKADQTLSPADLANRLHGSDREGALLTAVNERPQAPNLAMHANQVADVPSASITLQAAVMGLKDNKLQSGGALNAPDTEINPAVRALSNSALSAQAVSSTENSLPAKEVVGLKALDAEALAAEVNNSLQRAKAMQQVGLATAAANQLAAASSQPEFSPAPGNSQSIDNFSALSSVMASSTPNVTRVDASSGTAAVTTTPLNVPLLSSSAPESLANNVRWMVKEGVQSANINVSPSGMGPISVKVGIENDQMSIAIVASQATTRDALDAMLPKLREQLMSQGQDTVKVDVSDGRPDQSKGQQNNQQAEHYREGAERSLAGSDADQQKGGNDADTANSSLSNELGERLLSDSERDLAMQLQRLSLEPGSASRVIQHGYDLYV